MQERLITGRVRKQIDLPRAPLRDGRLTPELQLSRITQILEVSRRKQEILAIRDTDPVPELSEAGGQRIMDRVMTFVKSDILLSGGNIAEELPRRKIKRKNFRDYLK